MWIDPASLPAYAVVIVSIAMIAGAIMSGAFDWDRVEFAHMALPVSFFLLVAYAARWLGFDRIAAPCEMIMLFIAATFLMSFCSVIAASSAAPLADEMLARWDMALFHFDRRAAMTALTKVPLLMSASTKIYLSLSWTPLLLLCLLVIRGKSQLAWRLFTAMLLSLCVSIVALALVPAYGSPPYAYRFVEVLDGIRDGSLRRFDTSVITGLVTFPSMHAAYGVILARGFAALGAFAWPFVLLNVAMIGSALVVGGHYLIDLVAGCVVAWATMKFAKA